MKGIMLHTENYNKVISKEIVPDAFRDVNWKKEEEILQINKALDICECVYKWDDNCYQVNVDSFECECECLFCVLNTKLDLTFHSYRIKLDGESFFKAYNSKNYSTYKFCSVLKTQAGDPEILESASVLQSTESVLTGDLMKDTQPQAIVVEVESTNKQKASAWKTSLSIQEMISRPVTISQDTWSSVTAQMTRNGPNTPIISLTFPQDILSNSTFITDKLENFKYFRADLMVTVKVNATPMMQGMLVVVYQPFENVVAAIEGTRSSNHLSGITSYPHGILNLGENDSVTLKLPYCSDEEYFDLVNPGQGEFGEIKIYILSKLTASALPTTVTVTTIAAFVDPEVHGPFLPTPAAQIYKDFGSRKATLKHMLSDMTMTNLRPQAGDNELAEEGSKGIITKVSSTVSQLLEQNAPLLNQIPVLNTIVPELTWAARIVNRVASSFGFSKPNSVAQLERYTFMPGHGMSNVEGMDASYNMAAIPDPRIDCTDAIPSSLDEMSFAYIYARKYVTHASINWAVADLADNSLHSHLNTAITLSPSLTTGPHTIYGGVGEFLASQFVYWRGSIEYEFHVVKTRFHTGRFLIQFHTGTEVPGIADVDKVITQICDISKQSVFKIVIPYIANYPYCHTFGTAGGQDGRSSTGTLFLTVLNELKAPDTVAQYVDIVMYKNYGTDFELAGMMPAAFVTRTAPALSLPNKKVGKARKLVVQAGDDIVQSNSTMLDNLTVLNIDSFIPNRSLQLSTSCIGEKLTSVRQMIKRFGGVSNATFNTATTAVNINLNPALNYTGVGSVYAPCAVMSYIYRFMAGGVRAKVAFIEAQTTHIEARFNAVQGPLVLDGSGPQVSFTKHNDLLELEVPYYSNTRLRVIGETQFKNVTLIYKAAQTTLPDVYLAGADDLNYNFLVGPPAWIVDASTLLLV